MQSQLCVSTGCYQVPSGISVAMAVSKAVDSLSQRQIEKEVHVCIISYVQTSWKRLIQVSKSFSHVSK
jgi:hypothetical protein